MLHFNYGQPRLSMENHRQATPQQAPTNYSKILDQYNDFNSRPTSQYSTQIFAINEPESGESSPPVLFSLSTQFLTQKKQHKGEGRMSVIKGIGIN